MAVFASETLPSPEPETPTFSVLADPAGLSPRVVLPAEALHGRYHSEISYPDGQ